MQPIVPILHFVWLAFDLGRIQERLGQRDDAIASYRVALRGGAYPVEARIAESPALASALLSPAPSVFASISLPLHGFTMGRLPITSAPSIARACSGSRMELSSTSLITAAPTASRVERSSASIRFIRVFGYTGFSPGRAASAMRIELF